VDEFLVAALKAKEGEPIDTEDYQIACSVAEIFAAGNTTTSHSLEWLFAWLATHPELQTRLREEIHSVFGKERIPENMDVSQLTLLDSTIKEVCVTDSELVLDFV
jgi:cytochrome P450